MHSNSTDPSAAASGGFHTGSAIRGTYHAFKFAKYAERYLAEYQFRFNRRFDLEGLTQSLIRAAVACKPAPLTALRMAEDCR